MPVRTAYDPTAGEILTATNLEKLAGGWIGYIETTSDQTGITSIVDLTGLSVAVTVGPARRIKVTAVVNTTISATGNSAVLILREGATSLNGSARFPSVANGQERHEVTVVLTPTTGAHTYKVSASVGIGGTMTAQGSTNPAVLIVEDIGPA